MNKAQFIFMALAISAVVGGYNVIVSVLELGATDEVDKTQQELLIDESKDAVSKDRSSNLQKYGCENPAVGPGFVSCP